MGVFGPLLGQTHYLCLPPDLLTALASDASGALGGGHDALVGHVDKEAVINHANSVLEGGGGRLDVLDGLLERKIDDVVAVVCRSIERPLTHLRTNTP